MGAAAGLLLLVLLLSVAAPSALLPASSPSLLFASALPVSGSQVLLGAILPFTNNTLTVEAQRVRGVVEMLVQDINSGVAVGGRPAYPFGSGVTLAVEYFDSKGTEVGAVRALFDLVARSYGPPYNGLVLPSGVYGCLSDDVTPTLDMVANSIHMPLVSPMSYTASMTTSDHPTFWRPSGDDYDAARLLINLVREAEWKRAALLIVDDDRSIGFQDILQRSIVEINAGIDAQAAADDAAGIEVSATSLLAREHHEISTYMFPSQPSATATAVIAQAIDHLKAHTDTRIFIIHASVEVAVQIMETAYAKGMVGIGPDGIMRQWVGTACARAFADAFQDRPEVLYGFVCDVPASPRVEQGGHEVASWPVNAAAVAFEERLKAFRPSVWPADSHIDVVEIDAASALFSMVFLLADTFASSLPNTASSVASMLPITFERVDGLPLLINANGTAKVTDVDRKGWSMEELAFVTTHYWNVEEKAAHGAAAVHSTHDPLVLATGSSAFTKDRARVYVTGDALPAAFDGKFVVLAYVIAVLGGWTALILLEQALSFWSRGVWKQAVGWVVLGSIAFGFASVWPNAVMLMCALTLDVDALLNLQQSYLVATAVYPVAVTFLAFMLCMHGVEGGFKAAANVNVDRVSDITDGSSTSQSGASGSGSHSTSRSRFRVARNRFAKQVDKIRDFVSVVGRQSGLQLLGASILMGILFVTELVILEKGFYLRASFSVNIGYYFASFVVAFVISIVSLSMYFHTTRSGWRYASPFLLCIGLLGSFFVVMDLGGSWIYVSETDITTAGRSGTAAADNSLALVVAVVSAAVCLLLMVFNVHRLRLSRNVLDKVLNQVAGQVRSLESDIDAEKDVCQALIEQAAFFRRSLEIINLCRPVWRPYAIALAMADPEERNAAALAIEKQAIAALGTLEKERPDERKKLAPAGTKDKEKQANKEKEKSLVLGSKIESKDSSLHTKPASKKSVSKEADKEKDKDLLLPVKQKVTIAEPNAKATEEAKEAEPSAHGSVMSGGAGPEHSTAGKLPGTVLTPEQRGRKMAVAPASVAPASSITGASVVAGSKSGTNTAGGEKESSAGGSGTIASGARGAAAAAAATAATQSDFHRVHAWKKEKQLLALLKELSDLRLTEKDGGGPPPSRVIQDVKLPQMLSHPVTLELMKDVLQKNLSPENIALWIDIQRYRSLENPAVRKAVADEICQTFIVSGAKFEVNLSSFMRDYVRAQVNKGGHALDLFDEVEKEIYRLMVTNNFEPLVQSSMFKLAAVVLQHPLFKLKAASLQNNTKGEVGGNVAPTIGTNQLLAPAAAVQQQYSQGMAQPAAVRGSSVGLSGGVASGVGSRGIGGARPLPSPSHQRDAAASSQQHGGNNSAANSARGSLMWPTHAGAHQRQGSNTSTPQLSPAVPPTQD